MRLPDLRIAQALVLVDARGVRVVATTTGFDAAEAERIAVMFGTRPPGVACPLAHFACPFGANHVAVVRVEDQPGNVLGFRFLVLARGLYRHLGDPFAVADHFPPNWAAVGTMPELAWPPRPLPSRSVDEIQALLKAASAGCWMDLLLGGTQALVDGGRVLLRRSGPSEEFLRGLWQLLPDRTRCDLWPASFAFSDDLQFDAVALPELPEAPHSVRLGEDGIRDYPQSKYELEVQIAAEAGDQRELDRLFARRTGVETMRLGLLMIALATCIAVIAKLIFG